MKTQKNKSMSQDLIGAGMLTEGTRKYLIDCTKQCKSIILTGPPMSGKTALLNWLLQDGFEEYKKLFITQEYDDLFAYKEEAEKNGDIVNSILKKELQLDPGCDIQGNDPYISDAIYCMNSGDQAIVTVHGQSTADAVGRMARLIQRENKNTTYEQAQKMVSLFDVIVYMEGHKVQKIQEIIGYNEEEGGLVFRDAYNAEDN